MHRSIDGQRFSRWFYGYASAHGDIGVLPVELLYFKGKALDAGNLLQWSTGSESGSEAFIVERSPDLSAFRPIARVTAAGDSWTPLSYEFTDREAPAGLSYYRLRIEDLDGSHRYSDVVPLQRGIGITIHPNPVMDLLTWESGHGLVHRARIVDGLGRLVAEVPATSGSIQGKPLLDLPYGLYSLLLLDEAGNVLARSRFLKS